MDKKIHIIYGTRSGNSRLVAGHTFSFCRSAGLEAKIHDIRQVGPRELQKFSYLLLIVSTHGEGDPPDAVEPFYGRIHEESMPSLDRLRYAVFALGDSNYRNFCQTGKDLDHRLDALGASRILEVCLSDLDFELAALGWIEKICGLLVGEILGISLEKVVEGEAGVPELSRYSDRYLSRVVEKKRLSGEGSTKEVFHVTLATGKQKLPHKPGDCLKILGRNPRGYVDEIIRAMGFNPAEAVMVDGRRKLLKEVLVSDVELTQLTPLVVKEYAKTARSPDLDNLVKCEQALLVYAQERDVLDLVTDYPCRMRPGQFIPVLRRLHPRSYSIASGILSHPEEIHLTVSRMHFSLRRRDYTGVTSNYLHEMLKVGDPLEFIYEPSEAFRLPESPEVPLIMLATSTGIAPFRAILQDRQAAGIKGNTWLIFGDRHLAADFLYQEEIHAFLQAGTLERLDLAFSRDRQDKYYLQHKIAERQVEIVDWINRGGHIYLCGTKNTMAREVRSALVSALGNVHGWSSRKAESFFRDLRESSRYNEDIY